MNLGGYDVYVHMYCSNWLDISLVEKGSVVNSKRGASDGPLR